MTFIIDNFMRRICSTRGDMTQESVENFSGKIAGEFSYKSKVKTRPYRPKLEYIYIYVCVCVCVYMCIYVYIYIYIYMYTYLLHCGESSLRS